MSDCANCGRVRGDAFERDECAYPGGQSCANAARTWPVHDALRRELADAKAEVARLRKLFDDAGQGEHNVLALVDHYIAEAEKAALDRDDAADLASANAQWVRHYQREREKRDVAVAEADELRRLAWEWCIEARRQCESVLWLLQRVGDDESPPAYSEAMADKAGPLPTAVLAQTEVPIDPAVRIAPHGSGDKVTFTISKPEPPVYIDPAHEPIESLGPVPADVPGSLRSRVEWLVRDAVRRGAKLEGE